MQCRAVSASGASLSQPTVAMPAPVFMAPQPRIAQPHSQTGLQATNSMASLAAMFSGTPDAVMDADQAIARQPIRNRLQSSQNVAGANTTIPDLSAASNTRAAADREGMAAIGTTSNLRASSALRELERRAGVSGRDHMAAASRDFAVTAPVHLPERIPSQPEHLQYAQMSQQEMARCERELGTPEAVRHTPVSARELTRSDVL